VSAWAARLRASLENLSAEQAALLLTVGLVLGVFPIVGCPTVLCLLAAPGLRLNVAALQVLNNASSPLQLALFIPFARAGARLCGCTLRAGHSAAGGIGTAAFHAIAGWACVGIPAGAMLYLLLIAVMRKGRPLWFNDVKSPS
jgi:hypothetical protein